jgi:hypothetical protein
MRGRVSGLSLSVRGERLILRGLTTTYYAKQLAQHAVMETTDIPILANEIEVRRPWQDALTQDFDSGE